MDRLESILSLRVGRASAGADEVGIERCGTLIALVEISARGIGLPELDESPGIWPAFFLEQPAGDDNALSERLAAGTGVSRQIRVAGTNGIRAKRRPGQLRHRGIEPHHRLARCPQHGRPVRFVQVWRVHPPVAPIDHVHRLMARR